MYEFFVFLHADCMCSLLYSSLFFYSKLIFGLWYFHNCMSSPSHHIVLVSNPFFLPFIKPQVSWPYIQEPTTVSYPEPWESKTWECGLAQHQSTFSHLIFPKYIWILSVFLCLNLPIDLLLGFSDFVCIFHSFQLCCMFCPSHPYWLSH